MQKYGGSSVADPEKVKNIAKRVIETKKQGNDVVVVVSAMGKTTDGLLDLAHKITDDPDPREIDMLLSTGEQISIAVMAMAIHSLGELAISMTGPQVGILTDSAHRKAKIVRINENRILTELKAGKVVIAAGFQGSTVDNQITTLGRGGSDTTAVALAAVLKADVCEIYTDVDGVYTTDPRICPNARKLDRISYNEMLELASLGAKVLHSRSVELAKNFDVPLHVRSSFKNEPGTMVSKEVKDMEDIVVSGVAYNKGEAKVSMVGVPDKPGIAAEIFGTLANNNIIVDMIIQNIAENGLNDISFTVSKEDLKQTIKTAKELSNKLGAKDVVSDEKIAKVSVVGVGMKSHSGVAAKMFNALAKNNINIESISTSEIKISCIIREEDCDKAVVAIHSEFELANANG